MFKSKIVRILCVCILTLLIVLVMPQAIYAQSSKSGPQVIPEDQRPKAFWPWIATGVLSVGTVMVGIKNARRSHLD